jgi:hypothetical protein
MNVPLPEEEIYGLVEMLGFIAGLCSNQQEQLNVALCRYTGGYYPAKDLRADVLQAADRLAQAIGLADASLERSP